ncbi:ty3-gypsy retrotransposon protein [Tanacetum coccineum]
MQINADKHKRDVQFKIREKVYLKLRPYQQRSVANRNNVKLAPRYFGPFDIEEKVRKLAYKLKLPDTASIHPVFHVSQLKKAIGDYKAVPNLLAGLNEYLEVVLQPEAVLGVRPSREKKNGREVLIRWKNLPLYDASWEQFDYIEQQFPEFRLEDKVLIWEGGNVTGQVYQRPT